MEVVSYLLRAFLIPPAPGLSWQFLAQFSSFFSPLFRRFLRLAPKIPDTGTKKVTERARNVDMMQMAGKNHIA